MYDRLNRAWRVVGTGIAFAAFGLTCLLLRVAYFPLLPLRYPAGPARARAARLGVHYGCKGFVELMRLLGLLRYDIRSAQRLQRDGLLIIANHPTLIDVVFLFALVPNANCVVKGALASNFFTRGPVRAANYLCNDSGPGLIKDCIESIRLGDNLIIFPEGTRTRVGEVMPWQRGAANIAVRGPYNVTPVTIRCVPISLTKGTPWWRVPPKPMRFTIVVGEDIPIAPYAGRGPRGTTMAARALTQHLHDFFTQETPADASA